MEHIKPVYFEKPPRKSDSPLQEAFHQKLKRIAVFEKQQFCNEIMNT
jgi:hypothetical protein